MHRRLYEVRQSLKMTQTEIARILGIGQNAYSMIENGRISLTERNRALLHNKLGVNPDYLIDGIEPMLLPIKLDSHPSVSSASLSTRHSSVSGVPYFSKPISGLIQTPGAMANEEPEYYINMEPFNDCTFYRPVFGESMIPRYNSGDIVACKRVNNKNLILYGESYLCLIAEQGDFYETIKVLRRHAEQGMITLMPYNASFDETTIPLSSILELYLIKGKIERNV